MEKNTKIILGVGVLGLLSYVLFKKNTMLNFNGLNKNFEEFSKKRGEGGVEIAQNSKEKGGLAILTYYHYDVKAPYYKKAQDGTLNLIESKKELEDLIRELHHSIKFMTIEQVNFQKLVGKIEVLGELLIENKENYE